MNTYSIKNEEDKEKLINLILNDIKNETSSIIVGDFQIGKTTILETISQNLNLPVIQASTILKPNLIQILKIPKGDLILVDEATRFKPEKTSLQGKYKVAIVGTHYREDGEYYAKFLTQNDNLRIYNLKY